MGYMDMVAVVRKWRLFYEGLATYAYIKLYNNGHAEVHKIRFSTDESVATSVPPPPMSGLRTLC